MISLVYDYWCTCCGCLYRADVDLCIEDFNTIGDRVPLLANLKPHGKVRGEI